MGIQYRELGTQEVQEIRIGFIENLGSDLKICVKMLNNEPTRLANVREILNKNDLRKFQPKSGGQP